MENEEQREKVLHGMIFKAKLIYVFKVRLHKNSLNVKCVISVELKKLLKNSCLQVAPPQTHDI